MNDRQMTWPIEGIDSHVDGWVGKWNKSKLTDAEAAEGPAFAHNRPNRRQLQSAKLNDSTLLPLYPAA
jgi:hypothetical protein